MSGWRVVRAGVILAPVFALAGAGIWFVAREFGPTAPPPHAEGRLVVVAVFDQMRGDYPDRWAPLFEREGFERVKAHGVWYSDAHLPYACTETGPGHASIATGVPPSVHGIVGNEWYDRAKGKTVYCSYADRAYERIPANPAAGSRASAKAGTEGGLAPTRLLVPTVADALRAATSGKGRTFSIALKDRAAVLTAGKEPDGCYCFDTATGQFHTSAYYRERVHPWVEHFNKSGVADQWFGKEWDPFTSQALYNKYAGPDDVVGEMADATGAGRTFPHLLSAGLTEPSKAYYAAVEASPFGNELVWSLARSAIEQEELGRGSAPDLLYLGFSSNDIIGHAFGPDSHEVLDVTLRSDKLVAQMIEYLNAQVGPGRYALVITADHGVCPMPEVAQKDHPGAARFNPKDFGGPLGKVLDSMYGAQELSPGRWVESYSYPWVYLNQRLMTAQGIPAVDVEDAAAQWLGNRDFAKTAYTRTSLAGPPLADPIGRSVQLGFHPDRSGDVCIIPKPYQLPIGGPMGTNHGSPWPYDTHVPILACGCGIPGLGKQTKPTSALLVAPIVCRALGIDPPAILTEKLPPEFE
ncbi:alkaline phosphatase family protein [Fimbriiglobus ruber]|uniref:Alkaline phosphatase n=1 Tax=Fimbriiglobus ruber TaxID=1908690 RepID=A0A225DSR7_9BACT|nr:alkaline phosphatase family protein [Fimbriiglobus ruber]OWK40616.1 Alkaline phosphatase [Fimbriiglobus ruber]